MNSRHSILISILSGHFGRENGITMRELQPLIGQCERRVRQYISNLRKEGYAICGTPLGGYYVAATAEEMEETCRFLRSRAMHSLVLEARLRKIPLADLLGQLPIPT
ncbi:MAG: hypothetical protein WB870_09535 [Gallionellaceae bacterium]